MRWILRRSIIAASLAGLLAACAEPGEYAYSGRCEAGLRSGTAALKRAEADGLSESAGLTKAAALLGAARVQSEFEEYQNCALKAERAQEILRGLSAE